MTGHLIGMESNSRLVVINGLTDASGLQSIEGIA